MDNGTVRTDIHNSSTGFIVNKHSRDSIIKDLKGFVKVEGGIMAPTHNLHSGMPGGLETIPMREGINSCKPTTLQSVLRGEIPAAYSHLTSHQNVEHSRPIPMPKTRRLPSHHMVRHESEEESPVYHTPSQRQEHPVLFGVHMDSFIPSPVSGHHQILPGSPKSPDFYDRGSPETEQRSLYLSHRSSPYLDHRKEHRTSPYPDRRCVLSHREREATASFDHGRSSPFMDHRSSPYVTCSPRHSPRQSPRQSYSPYNLPPSPYAQQTSPCGGDVFPGEDLQCSSQDAPMDLSCKSDIGSESPARYSDFNTPCDSPSTSPKADGSMLRNLLVAGKQSHFFGSDSEQDQSPSGSHRPDIPITSSTRVTLAKKNMYPITSRVSDWLVKIVKFSKSIPEFETLSQNDKMTLLLNSWTRLLLLYMAEQDFEFAVTPLPTEQQTPGVTPSADEPTMKSVENIQSFIKKCKSMTLDQKEYALLRMAVLFNAGYVGLDRPELVDQLNSVVQQLLQQHVSATRPDDVMHYSRLLMCLPALYGINCRMFENLFCKHLKTDIEVLIKEMLQTL